MRSDYSKSKLSAQPTLEAKIESNVTAYRSKKGSKNQKRRGKSDKAANKAKRISLKGKPCPDANSSEKLSKPENQVENIPKELPTIQSNSPILPDQSQIKAPEPSCNNTQNSR